MLGKRMITFFTENIQLSALRHSREPWTRTADGDFPELEQLRDMVRAEKEKSSSKTKIRGDESRYVMCF
ncbi:hypothetical protein BDV28DRAFT_144518 [Aspergillus coremiiformis]|uniref:Uncharacterized protein n=1 Tax=Aspergillus coremiiformis TaxID=138285 RepID=A0A5N6YR54_9EURO|nr:hypothetical protein BDV28DRAFT_144518 [Aspergillus coremiiformis]